MLDDEHLKEQVHQIASSVIAKQLDNGWIGPETDPSTCAFWARYPVSLGFMNLVDANSTWEESVVNMFGNFVDYIILSAYRATTRTIGIKKTMSCSQKIPCRAVFDMQI
ncbi:hypothetical protein BT96DRAFT_1007779 [Gymnopus androsaceus JB14]|uniref:Uncharacterized protein n=1 Tax=Gymnopus androsaceus JB14 TaxID=1447944 RepID=A0A6A4GGH9_9AGAR|nr:hypothetical protein BT96DRAFT_1007779 [Gymnopus androsaceus JB14]